MFSKSLTHARVLSRVRPSVPSEPASFIARALNRRLPDRIRGAGTLYLWLRRGRTALRVARRLSANGREHEFIDACARIPLGEGAVQVCTAELGSALSEAEAQGIGTIVEGIEVKAELSWVRENGAHFVQGFLLGKPSPVARS